MLFMQTNPTTHILLNDSQREGEEIPWANFRERKRVKRKGCGSFRKSHVPGRPPSERARDINLAKKQQKQVHPIRRNAYMTHSKPNRVVTKIILAKLEL